MCSIINKIKNWLFPKKQCCKKQSCHKFENVLLEKASLSKEEVDSVIINSLKKVKQQKKTKPKTKVKAKVKPKKSKR
jgi:hypothetical protein